MLREPILTSVVSYSTMADPPGFGEILPGRLSCAVSLGGCGWLVGFGLALLFSWSPQLAAWGLAVPMALVGFFVISGSLDRARQREVSAYKRRERTIEDELSALSPEQIRARATRSLHDTRLFTVQPRGEPASPPFLPAENLGAFLNAYAAVEEVDGDLSLNLETIAPWESDPTFFVLGYAEEHTYVACRPENETIFILAEDVEEAVEAEHPSIYHYLLRRALEAQLS